MITNEMYQEYFGVDTAPCNLTRLEFLSLEELKSIINRIPATGTECYDNFLKALMEQINYFDINGDLIDDTSSGTGYTLGKYREGGDSSSSSSTSDSDRISPMAYSILLNCGLLYAGVKVVCRKW